MKTNKKNLIRIVGLLILFLCICGKVNSQTQKYVKDLTTDKVYHTQVTINSNGSLEFVTNPEYEVEPPTTEPEGRVYYGGPRETKKYSLYDQESGTTHEYSVTICHNEHIWPCAWCANSL